MPVIVGEAWDGPEHREEDVILHIQLLGQPQLRVDGAALSFKAPVRALALLVYIVLHRHRPLARDEVAAIFWPDCPVSEAKARLRYDIREVRDVLPRGKPIPWILTNHRTMQWNPNAPAIIDVAEFERLAARPESAGAAVEWYAGDLAAQLEDEWLAGAREHFRLTQSRLLYELMMARRAQDDVRGAIAYAQRLVAHDPWREDAVRALIELRHETGDRAGALRMYVDFAGRLEAELGVEPMPETVAVYDRISTAGDAEARTCAFPQPLTSFIGRESELAVIRDLLEHRRLITLLGSGGVGKTRLAIETARTLGRHFADGIRLVEFAPIADAALILSTIARAVDVQNASESSLIAALQEKQLLLVFDNCEHLVVDIARIAERLVRECPTLRILATSREPLRVAGERVERVVSLAQPAAIRLFLERAADVSPASPIDAGCESDRIALEVIAERLDGIPLAIEFAAARASSLHIGELAQRLDDRFTLLTSGSRSALPRQQTLRATLDWSFDLLTPIEQRLLCRAGVFAGTWNLEAMAIVCSGDEVDDARIVDALASLVDKSLVVVDTDSTGGRYRLLETTRAYALDRLAQNDERDAIARRHAEYFLAFAQRNDNTWGTIDSRAGLERFHFELDNCRAALSWAIDAAQHPVLGASLAGSMRWAFAARSLNAELVRWCDAGLAALGPRPDPVGEAALQLALAGSMGAMPFLPRFHFHRAGAPARFLASAQRAADLLRHSERDGADLALALSLVAVHLRLANPAQAAPVAAEALTIARAGGHPLAIAIALYASSFTMRTTAAAARTALLCEALPLAQTCANLVYPAAILFALGEVAFESGDAVSALAYARESAAQPNGRGTNEAQSQSNCAAYCLALEKIDEARISARYVLSVAARIGEPMIAAAGLQHAAGIAVAQRDPERAARLLGASDARRIDAPQRLFTEQTGYAQTLTAISARLSTRRTHELIHEGAGWSFNTAIQEALLI